jgi:hypothetical protein
MRKALILWVVVYGSLALAQSRPEAGATDLEIWTGGGHSVSGGTSNTGVWSLGLRYGWVLTRPHGPAFLKGRFEYAVEAVPAFVLFQPLNTAYGVGVNPVNLKWNFATRGSTVPYLEIDGGTLFTNQEAPAGTSKVNFTSGAALGTHFLRLHHYWSVELRYMHISNAGLSSPNPGINTVQLRLGLGKFRSSTP